MSRPAMAWNWQEIWIDCALLRTVFELESTREGDIYTKVESMYGRVVFCLIQCHDAFMTMLMSEEAKLI